MITSLTPREAANQILAAVRVQPPLRIPLDDALGSILATDVTSPIDIPPWPNSAMDGYAARASDVRGATPEAPVRLRVVEEIPAGHFPTRALGPGEAARIFTGAPVPAGADSVVRQEDTDQGKDEVQVLSGRDAGVNIRAAGEDVRSGALVLTRGMTVGPAELVIIRETDKPVANLLLSDGTQYRIDGPSPGLSPDKRWLVFRSVPRGRIATTKRPSRRSRRASTGSSARSRASGTGTPATIRRR